MGDTNDLGDASTHYSNDTWIERAHEELEPKQITGYHKKLPAPPLKQLNGVPGLPGLPGLPGQHALGGMPSLAGLAALPELGEGLPGLDSLGGMPDLTSGLPGLDSLGGLGGLGDLAGGLGSLTNALGVVEGLPVLSTLGGLGGLGGLPGLPDAGGMMDGASALSSVPGLAGGLPDAAGLVPAAPDLSSMTGAADGPGASDLLGLLGIGLPELPDLLSLLTGAGLPDGLGVAEGLGLPIPGAADLPVQASDLPVAAPAVRWPATLSRDCPWTPCVCCPASCLGSGAQPGRDSSGGCLRRRTVHPSRFAVGQHGLAGDPDVADQA